jgi:uncharacterized protein
VAKLLLVIAVFAVVYLIVRAGRNKSEGAAPPSATREEDMVRCQVCGVHLPRSEALSSREDFFCTEEHLRISRGDRD